MKNPLRKRYIREFKSDAGKYLVIFLFLSLFISMVSGFLIADNNFKIAYDEGFSKYNIEDGHITFDGEVPESLLETISNDAELTFYDLQYFEETVSENKTNLRVYKKRNVVNIENIMSGKLPEYDNEIALDRLYASNNSIDIGDRITINNSELTVCGFLALPDYSCLFENNSDMMFDAINFGVAVMTEDGYNQVESKHIYNNFSWKYNTEPVDDIAKSEKSEAFLDVLEDDIKEYDTDVIQRQIDELYDRAENISNTLTDEFETFGTEFENKAKSAGEDSLKDAVNSLSNNEKLEIILKKSGMTQTELIMKMLPKLDIDMLTMSKIMAMKQSGANIDYNSLLSELGISQNQLMKLYLEATGLSEGDISEAMIDAALKKKGLSMDGLIAAELGCSEENYKALVDSLEGLEDQMDSIDIASERKVIDLDDLDNSKDMSDEMNFSLDPLYDVVSKIDATGIYDTSKIRECLTELEDLKNFEIDESEIIAITAYVPQYLNSAINFTGEDMGKDAASFKVFSYIVICIIAFVFAVTINNTISKEAGVIGTLRASGYSKAEMIVHYMVLPIVVTLLGAIVGNVLGYTVMKDYFVDIYYGSYSLPTFNNMFNLDAFINTTIVPIGLMVVINLVVLIDRMQFTPLMFLRRQLSKTRKKKALKLSEKIPFIHRFRIRIFLQNVPAYLTLFIGIFLGAVIIIFGTMFVPLLKDYAEVVKESKISSYQYVLMKEVETDNPSAEKYCVTSLDYTQEGFMTDELTIFGISEDSRYINTPIPEGKVLISNGMAEKFEMTVGDVITLDDHYSKKQYEFIVGGIYKYDAALTVFVNRSEYNVIFGEDKDYYSGYFTNSELDDIDSDDIATVINDDDLTKVADQLISSMGDMVGIFNYFGVIMFLLLMYLLTKQIIEKNMISIAMTKILGFSLKEIGGLYIVMTSIVVIASLLISIPVTDLVLRYVFKKLLYTMMTGYIPYIVSKNCYITMIILGIISYAFVSVFMMLKINKIPKSEALKNVE